MKRTGQVKSSKKNSLRTRNAVSSSSQKPHKYSSIKKIILIVLLVVITPVAATAFYIGYDALEKSNYFTVKKIIVLGNQTTDRQDIIDAVSYSYGTNIFSVNLSELRQNILLDPFIRNVNLRRVLPNLLEIEVIERIPFAIIKSGKRSFLISEDAVVIQELSKMEKFNYPIINVFEKVRIIVGETLNSSIKNAVNVLLTIRENWSEYYANLIAINVSKNFKISLKLRKLNGDIIINCDDINKNLENLNSLLPKLYSTSFKYIDLRFKNKAIVKLLP